MKKIFIGANWKLHFDVKEVEQFFQSFEFQSTTDRELIIFPQPSLLSSVAKYQSNFGFSLGSQTNATEPQGAFTGETSAKALKSLGVKWGLVGHSERRSLFAESNEICLKKAQQLLSHGIQPLLCIGESKEIRQKGFAAVTSLLKEQLAIVTKLNDLSSNPLVIAYEPVWSIGTGITPTIQEVDQTLSWIVEHLKPQIGPRPLHVMYGGSVTKENAASFLALTSGSGLLIGGASLRPADLSKIYLS